MSERHGGWQPNGKRPDSSGLFLSKRGGVCFALLLGLDNYCPIHVIQFIPGEGTLPDDLIRLGNYCHESFGVNAFFPFRFNEGPALINRTR